MHLLERAEYPKAAAVFQPLGFHLAIPAFLHGASPGQLWADDPANPSAALLGMKQRLFLAGSPRASAGVAELLRERIVPQAKAAGDWGFLLEATPAWDELLPDLVPLEVKKTSYPRMYLKRPLPSPPEPAAPAPEGFSVVEVTRELVDDPALGGREDLLEEMTSERPSVDDFLAKSFGVVLLREGAVAGWCLSEYNQGDRCEVGIATAEPYRGQGLARLQGRAFLGMAHARGIRHVGWHCWAANVPSVRTALALGFEERSNYSVLAAEY